MGQRRPFLDADSRYVLNEAVEVLAIIRGCFDPDTGVDPGDALHLMWSLSLQINAQLLDAITQARAAGYTHERIRTFLTP